MNWYLKVLKQYADFGGRARRKEYWIFALLNIILAITATLLDNLFGITFGEIPYGPLYALYGLAVFIPALAVLVRRLHDTGNSGWMVLITLIPFIGAIWMLVLLVTDSEPGTNKWGPNPKINTEEIDMIGTE